MGGDLAKFSENLAIHPYTKVVSGKKTERTEIAIFLGDPTTHLTEKTASSSKPTLICKDQKCIHLILYQQICLSSPIQTYLNQEGNYIQIKLLCLK